MIDVTLHADVAQGVHRCGSGRVNWYLVEGGGGVTIVDAGFPAHFDILDSSLETLGYTMSDVEACLLTHGHPDHIGFADRIGTEEGLPVWIHEIGARRARAGGEPPLAEMARNLWRPAVFRYLLEVIRSSGLSTPAVDTVETFSDDVELDVPGQPRVYHVPGHTEGEVAFHLADRDVLLCGDALATVDFDTWRGQIPQLLPRWLNRDHMAALESVHRLDSLGRVTLLPGHGDPWTGTMAEAVSALQA